MPIKPQVNLVTVPVLNRGMVQAPSNNGVTLPPLPVLTQAPPAATLSPMTGFNPVSPPVSLDSSGYQNPYDNVAQMMQQRAMMASIYGN